MMKTNSLQITPELLALVAEIDEFKGAWRALGKLAPERLKALRHIATIESIGSSTRIEGSKLTDREVGCLLANLEIKRFTIRTEAPDWQPWLLFFLRALQQQKRRLAIKVEREKNALAILPELAVKILDYVRDHGRVTTRDMVRETGTSPNTLKTTFTSLVEKGLLARHGGGRSTWYSLP